MELKNISVNGAKGKGKGSWTSAQTSVIAKNGGEIITDNFKDIGAIVGSENEKEKLKISAKTIEVKDLEDSNKYENVGGGISLDFEENKPQVPNISVVHDKIDKEQITRATAINTEIKVNNEIVKAEDLGFNTDISNSQETTKDKEKHLNAELHTDLLGKDKQEELKKAAGIISDIGTALTSSKDTKGDFLERYKQASMMRAIGDQVEKNPEYLSILEKEAIKNGKIDDELQEKQVSVMNKLLNDALRAKGYAGPDIKMVLTDVTDPNGPYYTDTLTNVVVFDRKELAKSNRDQILNALGHEFGHYSKEDDIDKSQDIANHTGKLLEDRTRGMVAKEATEDTLARIRNNLNVITGEEGKKLAESIPMDRREYYTSEIYFSTSEASLIRMAQSYSKYTSYSTDTVTEYSIGNMDIGAGTPDLSISAGVGLYAADTPEELMKLTNSYGGSTDILGITVGVDVIYKPLEKYNFLSFLNVRGIKLYGGIGVPILKAEGHVSIKNFGKVMNEKKYKTLEYYKNKSLPYNIRQYYQYNYKLEEKSDRK